MAPKTFSMAWTKRAAWPSSTPCRTRSKKVGREDGNEEQKKSVRGSALREFDRFLDDKDPKHTLVAEPDGSCCSTSDVEVEKTEAEGKAPPGGLCTKINKNAVTADYDGDD